MIGLAKNDTSELVQLSVRLSGLTRKLQGEVMRGPVRKALDSLANVVRDAQRDVIATTPSGLSPGKPDRIWSGQMHDDVGRTKVMVDGFFASVRVGWVKRHFDYYLFQEYGHDPNGVRKDIAPMHMLMRTADMAREELADTLQTSVREDIANILGGRK